MRFNNGSADRQAHAHAGILCREETIKKMGEMRRIYSRAELPNDDQRMTGRLISRAARPTSGTYAPAPSNKIEDNVVA
jgi:hypothetical protein